MLQIQFQVPRSSGSLVLQPTTVVTDRWTDGQTDRRTGPNQYAPSTSSKLYRAQWKKKSKKKKKKKKKRRRERKMDLQVANPTEYNERKNKNRTQ